MHLKFIQPRITYIKFNFHRFQPILKNVKTGFLNHTELNILLERKSFPLEIGEKRKNNFKKLCFRRGRHPFRTIPASGSGYEMGTRKQVAESILVSAKVYLFIFFTNNIYCNIFSKSLKGSFRELSLFTFEYLKDTNARQDRTHTHKKAKE